MYVSPLFLWFGLVIRSSFHTNVFTCTIFLARSNIVCDNKHMLVGLSNGSLYNISWKGEVMLK